MLSLRTGGKWAILTIVAKNKTIEGTDKICISLDFGFWFLLMKYRSYHVFSKIKWLSGYKTRGYLTIVSMFCKGVCRNSTDLKLRLLSGSPPRPKMTNFRTAMVVTAHILAYMSPMPENQLLLAPSFLKKICPQIRRKMNI